MKAHLGLVIAALVVPAPASAATFLLKYKSDIGSPMTAQLRITTADAVNAVGGYDIQAVTGTILGSTISSLVANPKPAQAVASADGFFIYDNVYFPNAPALSNPGILFNGADGYEYNLFSRNLTQFELYQAKPHVGYTMNSVGTLSTVAVPEPAQWAMFLAGFLFVGSKLRRRRRVAPPVWA